MKEAKNSIKPLIILITSLTLIIFIGIFIDKILIPSYYSTVDGCYNKTSDNIQVLGRVQASYNNDTNKYEVNTIEIRVDKEDINYQRILKHELCHVKQVERGEVGNCDSSSGKLRRFFNEIDCYIIMYF